MLGNGKKTIGVILERPYAGFQNVLCQGIIQRAAELDYNVAVLSSFGNCGDNDSNFEGDQNLFELPEYEKFSGVIVVMDTLAELKSKERVLNNVKSRCKCPVIAARTSVMSIRLYLVISGITGVKKPVTGFCQVRKSRMP